MNSVHGGMRDTEHGIDTKHVKELLKGTSRCCCLEGSWCAVRLQYFHNTSNTFNLSLWSFLFYTAIGFCWGLKWSYIKGDRAFSIRQHHVIFLRIDFFMWIKFLLLYDLSVFRLRKCIWTVFDSMMTIQANKKKSMKDENASLGI